MLRKGSLGRKTMAKSESRMTITALSLRLKPAVVNIIALKRQVTDTAIERSGCPFQEA